MKILPSILKDFSKILAEKTSEEIVNALILLGFEAEVMGGKHEVMNIEVTPNRGDVMNHLGVARELQAFFTKNHKQNIPAIKLTENEKILNLEENNLLKIDIKSNSVYQYHGLIFDNVKIAESPDWLKDNLLLLGIKPINNFVDLTNYLMELYGQPLHVFDADLIYDRKLTLRHSKNGEKLITLDNTEHTLPEGVIVIEDGKELIDLSGIQGGKNSQVNQKTKRILLQSAIFDPTKIRTTSKKLNHRTDASFRYERGIDSSISLAVFNAFCDLVSKKEFGKQRPAGKIIALSEKNNSTKIKFDYNKINKLLGTSISKTKQEHYLALLGFDLKNNLVKVPAWRHDITIWQDLAEEIMRLEGLDANIPTKNLKAKDPSLEQSEWEWSECLKDALLELNFSEIQTYSFIGNKDLENFQFSIKNPLVNPLNPNFKYARPSLVPGIVRTIASNPWFDPIQVFEVGHIFGNNEHTSIAIGIAGRVNKIKDILKEFANKTACDFNSLLKLGRIYELNQKTKDAYKIRKNYVAVFEILLNDLRSLKPRIPVDMQVNISHVLYRPISKYPPSTRDISLIVDNSTSYKDIKNYVIGFCDLVENTILLDEFIHEKFGENKKSATFRIFYSDKTGTLEQQEVDNVNKQILTGLENTLHAIIR